MNIRKFENDDKNMKMQTSRKGNSRLDFVFRDKNLLKSKRSQVKIQEMSFMLLALILFMVLLGIFYIVFSNLGLRNRFEELTEAKVKSAVISLSDLPELNCGGETLCVDLDKAIVLKENPLFENYWELDGLIIRKIYPYTNLTIECSSSSYINCNQITIKEPKPEYDEISSFVALCWKDSVIGRSYDHCELGIISAYLEPLENEN